MFSSYQHSNAAIASWQFPLGSWNLSYNGSYSKYLTTVQAPSQSFQSYGNSFLQSFSLNKNIFRNKSIKTSLNSTLNTINSNNYTSQAFSTQSRNLTNVEFSLSNNLYTPYGSFFHKFSYIQGINAFGATADPTNTTYHSEFNAIRFYHFYNITTNKIFNGNLPLNFQNTIDSQYSFQELYSQNQFTLSGFYAVRGFRNSNIYGSSGILTRNDLNLPLQTYTNLPIIKNLTIGTFFDIGLAQSYFPTNIANSTTTNNGTMAGTGYKISYNSKYLQSTLTISYPITYPSNLSQNIQTHEPFTIYFNLKGVI